MITSAKCATCGRKFAGDRDEAFHWLRYHIILHELQGAVRGRLADLEAEESRLLSTREPAQSRAA